MLALNGVSFGDHVTELIVKLFAPLAVVFGVLPVTGAVTVIAALVITAVVTVSVLVFTERVPRDTAIFVLLCDRFSVVPFAGFVVIPFAAKSARLTVSLVLLL